MRTVGPHHVEVGRAAAALEGDRDPPAAKDLGSCFRADPQRRLPSGDKIDPIFEFLGDRGEPWRYVWIEVKHHARLSGDDQLIKYDSQLANYPPPIAERHVVFLPPAGYLLPPEQKPEGLVETNWQQVGKFVADWRERQPTGSRGGWIAEEFVRFLKEERLFVSEQLTTEDLHHLLEAERVGPTVAAILDEARLQIEKWVDAGGIPGGVDADFTPKRGSWWPSFWQSFGTNADLLGGWCEWYLQVPDGRDRPAFGAGLSFLTSASPPEEAWQRLGRAGLERADLDLTCARAFHWWAVDDFVDETESSDQVDALVGFVLGSLREVREALNLPKTIP